MSAASSTTGDVGVYLVHFLSGEGSKFVVVMVVNGCVITA